MILHIDAQNGIPIYDQIVRHVKYAVANRVLAAGEHVPSVRELAGQIAVNVNTVSRAYRQLQDDGVLVSIRGTGLAVTQDAVEICLRERQEIVVARLRSTLTEAFASGIPEAEIRKIFEDLTAELSHEQRDTG